MKQGIWVAFVCGFPLVTGIPSEGIAKELPITKVTTERSAGEAYFSPDGKQLIVLATAEDVPKSPVFIVDLETKTMRRLLKHEGEDACPYFSPDSQWVVFASTLHDPSRARGQVFNLDISWLACYEEMNEERSSQTNCHSRSPFS